MLVDRLSELFRAQPDEKVIVFTQFRETQRHLENLFTGRGWDVNVFHGQMSTAEKDRSIEQFRQGVAPKFLSALKQVARDGICSSAICWSTTTCRGTR